MQLSPDVCIGGREGGVVSYEFPGQCSFPLTSVLGAGRGCGDLGVPRAVQLSPDVCIGGGKGVW